MSCIYLTHFHRLLTWDQIPDVILPIPILVIQSCIQHFALHLVKSAKPIEHTQKKNNLQSTMLNCQTLVTCLQTQRRKYFKTLMYVSQNLSVLSAIAWLPLISKPARCSCAVISSIPRVNSKETSNTKLHDCSYMSYGTRFSKYSVYSNTT